MNAPADIAWVHARSPFGEVSLDPAIGNLRALRLRDGERWLSPLTRAPWVDQPGATLPAGMAPVERFLSGDFFCAAFGVNDVEDAPPHGWSANSQWEITEAVGARVRARLVKRAMGATLRKTLQLSENAPLLFQEHVIEGGQGNLTVAHHPMVSVANGARFACSPKRNAVSPDEPLEPGRNRLQSDQRSSDLSCFPGTGGSEVDLTFLPIAHSHEDFVTLVEAEKTILGWSAIVRDAEKDIVFFLKDARVLPVTMLWHSNGGRDYAPWNGTHKGILGVEDGCAAGAAGHRAALEPNAISALGVPTYLELAPSTTHRIVHVTGAIAQPHGWSEIVDIRLTGDHLILTGDTGGTRSLPFPPDLFEREA